MGWGAGVRVRHPFCGRQRALTPGTAEGRGKDGEPGSGRLREQEGPFLSSAPAFQIFILMLRSF